MKKINLIACAVAVAFAGVLVSCNQPTEMNDVTIVNHENSYTVTGTVTTTTNFKSVSTTGADGKENGGSSEVTKTLTLSSVNGAVAWTENAVLESNCDNTFEVSYKNGLGSSKTVVSGVVITDGTETKASEGDTTYTYDSSYSAITVGESENKQESFDGKSFSIIEINGAYYVIIDNQKVAVTADLTSGNTFSLKFSYTTSLAEGVTNKDEDGNVTRTNSGTCSIKYDYNLTFTAK
ncbi:MAG: hypothetical protein K5786_03735 [Treponema sp.]|nr:hypothetical protein [Treponema sp.]